MTTQPLYEKDLYIWFLDQSKHLHNKEFDKIDFINLAEEVESMGRYQRQELKNRLAVLFCHLLKVKYQPEYMGNSWEQTIREQRIQIDTLLEVSPSLLYFINDISLLAYEKGVKDAEKETGKILPSEAKYLNGVITLKDALESGWMP